MKIINVVGARPNFMKISPIIDAMNSYPDRIHNLLFHSGQYYDAKRGVHCAKLREHTERPVTWQVGTNHLIGNDPNKIILTVKDILKNNCFRRRVREKWDGKAAQKKFRCLLEKAMES